MLVFAWNLEGFGVHKHCALVQFGAVVLVDGTIQIAEGDGKENRLKKKSWSFVTFVSAVIEWNELNVP